MITNVSSSTSSASAQRPHRGHGPKLPESFKNLVDSTAQSVKDSGGSQDDIKAAIQSKYEDYKKTSDYTSLSADQKSKLDNLVANGPRKGDGPRGPRPTDAPAATTATTDADATDATDPSTVAKQLLDVLAQRGEQTRDRLGLTAQNQTAAATSIDAE